MSEQSSLLLADEADVVVTYNFLRDLTVFGNIKPWTDTYVYTIFDEIKRKFREKNQVQDMIFWPWFYSRIVEAFYEKLDINEEKLNQFAELLMKKQRGYGSAPLREWGLLGVVIRLDSKLARYKNLVANPSNAEGINESITDTLWDIIGYCILAVKLIQENDQEPV